MNLRLVNECWGKHFRQMVHGGNLETLCHSYILVVYIYKNIVK